MRVLFLTHYAELLGANRSLLALLGQLPKMGVEPLVLCPETGELTERLEDLHVFYMVKRFHGSVHVRKGFSFVKSMQRQLDNLLGYGELKAAVRNLAPDAIHTNTLVLHAGARLAADLGLPHVWHLRELGMSQYNLRYDFGERNARRRLRQAKALIAISEAVRAKVADPLGHPNVHTVYNGVIDAAELETLRASEAPRNAYPTFCLVGLFHPAKGQLEAVEAMKAVVKRVPEACLQLVGYGKEDYTTRLRDAVVSAGLRDNVLFSGYMKEPFDAFRHADAALMCSREEAMGRVTAEAMACGAPVIGYKGGATPELVSEGADGFLYETTEELAERMVRVAEDRAAALKMGQAGQAKAARLFTNERYAAQVREALRQAVEG